MRASFLAGLAFLALGAVAGAGASGRVIEVQDGAVVRVSATEPNLVEAGSGRVSSFVFTEGSVTETIDGDSGVVYFRPLAEGPISGFVETIDDDGARTRYSLVVVPDDSWPAQRIVLGKKAPLEHEGVPVIHVPVAGDHVARIKDLVRMLATNVALDNLQPEKERLALGELVLTKMAAVEREGLVGELLRVENQGAAEVEVDVTKLFIEPHVVAAAVSAEKIAPKEAVDAYLVREARPKARGLR